jgi:copper chaperone CopZ
MEEALLYIEGMHCEGCARKLSSVLERITGVQRAIVSFADGNARVAYDAQIINDARLREALEKQGCRVLGEQADTAGRPPAPGRVASETSPRRPRGSKAGLWALPALIVSLLPSATCPLCLAGYTALLSSVGLGFLISSAYLLPLTLVFLVIALTGLAAQAFQRRSWGAFGLGFIGSVLILAGKFLAASDVAVYAGVGLLLAASDWKVAPRLAHLVARSMRTRAGAVES